MRIVAILAATAGLAATGLAPAAAPTDATSLLAIRSGNDGGTLLRVDARTLTPLDGPTLPVDKKWGARALSPAGTQLALATNEPAALTFIDVVTMQALGRVSLPGAGLVSQVFWAAPDRVVATSWVTNHWEVVVVDPDARAVVARRAVDGNLSNAVGTSGGVVYVVAPDGRVGAAQLAMTALDGSTRSVEVERVRAGTTFRRVRGVPMVDIRQPGLAVDPAGRAFLVDASGLVGQVALDTMTVTYHFAPSARRLARAAKLVNGPMRYARWIGGGRIAVSGTNARARVSKTGRTAGTWASAGVSVIDTDSWRAQMIAPQGKGFASVAGMLLVPEGTHAFTAYESNGAPRYTVQLGYEPLYVQVVGRYAYAWGRRTTSVVDWASGQVLATVPIENLALIGD